MIEVGPLRVRMRDSSIWANVIKNIELEPESPQPQPQLQLTDLLCDCGFKGSGFYTNITYPDIDRMYCNNEHYEFVGMLLGHATDNDFYDEWKIEFDGQFSTTDNSPSTSPLLVIHYAEEYYYMCAQDDQIQNTSDAQSRALIIDRESILKRHHMEIVAQQNTLTVSIDNVIVMSISKMSHNSIFLNVYVGHLGQVGNRYYPHPAYGPWEDNHYNFTFLDNFKIFGKKKG